MDKQKQIEEMAKDICSPCHKGKLGMCEPKEGCVVWQYAKNAVEQGYRKIPEGAVVTKEEYDELEKCSYNSGRISKLLFHFDEELNKVRKEAVEKFAERLKELVADRNCNEDYEWEDVQVDGQIFIECVDEIAKEITEV